MTLTLKHPWLEPGFWPATLYESPFVELDATPTFDDVVRMESHGGHEITAT